MPLVREIMEPNVVWLPVDMPVVRAAEELSHHGIGGAPVASRDGTIVGVVSKTDLLEVFGSADEPRIVRDVMMPEVLSVGPDDPVERAVQIMAFEGVHRLVVRDRDGKLAGIVTSMDVLRALAGFARRAARVEGVALPEY